MATRARFDRDYYRTMGVGPDAGEEEIRHAYRRLALRWHPDRNPGDAAAAERFMEVSEAYAVLIDPAKRREYDRARQAGATGEFRHSREDLFRDLFSNPQASAIFEELARELERMGVRVDRRYFHQTLFGGRAVVTGGVFVVTPFTPRAVFRLVRAALRGACAPEPVSPPDAHPLPRPPGVLAALGRAGRWLLGLPGTLGPGPAGADVVLPLRLTADEAAHGARKRVVLNRGDDVDELLVTVPAGVRTGTRLRLRGKGRPAPNGTRGDVYLAVDVT